MNKEIVGKIVTILYLVISILAISLGLLNFRKYDIYNFIEKKKEKREKEREEIKRDLKELIIIQQMTTIQKILFTIVLIKARIKLHYILMFLIGDCQMKEIQRIKSRK